MPAGVEISADELAAAIGEASGRASFNGHVGGGDVVELGFGEQLHARVVQRGEDGEAIGPGQVASYMAKYACKGSHEQITGRGASSEQLRERGVPEQLGRITGRGDPCR